MLCDIPSGRSDRHARYPFTSFANCFAAPADDQINSARAFSSVLMDIAWNDRE
jgi:hypothetical protein